MMLAVLGVAALWLFYGWMLVTIACSYLSRRKGYGDRLGLTCGLLLYPLGLVVCLLLPSRPGSDWRRLGPVPRRGGARSPR